MSQSSVTGLVWWGPRFEEGSVMGSRIPEYCYSSFNNIFPKTCLLTKAKIEMASVIRMSLAVLVCWFTSAVSIKWPPSQVWYPSFLVMSELFLKSSSSCGLVPPTQIPRSLRGMSILEPYLPWMYGWQICHGKKLSRKFKHRGLIFELLFLEFYITYLVQTQSIIVLCWTYGPVRMKCRIFLSLQVEQNQQGCQPVHTDALLAHQFLYFFFLPFYFIKFIEWRSLLSQVHALPLSLQALG